MNMLIALLVASTWTPAILPFCSSFWTAKAIAEIYHREGGDKARETFEFNTRGKFPGCSRHLFHYQFVEQMLELETEDGTIYVVKVMVYGLQYPQYVITNQKLGEGE